MVVETRNCKDPRSRKDTALLNADTDALKGEKGRNEKHVTKTSMKMKMKKGDNNAAWIYSV